MNKLYFLVLIVIFTSCSIFQPEESSTIQPKLIKQSALPPVKQSVFNDKYEFYCELVINKHGDVESAKVLKGSGDDSWDSLTSISLLDWKFSPAIMNGIPTKSTVRRKFIVMFEKPVLMSLAEIQVKDITLADSIYKALVSGANFSEMAGKHSLSPSRELKGYLGKIDLKHYSKDIFDILNKLDVGEFTKPLSYGDNFIIFIRLAEQQTN